MASRRNFITGVATASTVAIAGCSSSEPDSGSTESEPESQSNLNSESGSENVVEALNRAMYTGDHETATEVTIPQLEFSQGDFSGFRSDFEPEQVEVRTEEITEEEATDRGFPDKERVREVFPDGDEYRYISTTIVLTDGDESWEHGSIMYAVAIDGEWFAAYGVGMSDS